MAFSAFPWVGGKTKLVDWIQRQLPTHTTYVEPFGGSAAVLLNKPRSDVEVFNDLDGDVVHFFEVARSRPDELAEWCRRTPFSEDLHRQWVDEFYSGNRPDDALERAGRWLFLRYSQFAGKVAAPSGFKHDQPGGEKGTREARNWASAAERIETVADRFAGVSVLNKEFVDVVDRYDTPETVFYVDPPYVGKEDLYRARADHEEIAATFRDCAGDAVISYTDLPDGLYEGPEWTVIERETTHNAGSTGKEVTERLVCTFDPADRVTFEGAAQRTLAEVGGEKA